MSERILIAIAALALPLASSLAAQQRFDTPDAAATTLIEAASVHDTARIGAIFGPRGNGLLASGNAAQDSADIAEFARLAQAKHQLEPSHRDPNRVILSIGDEDWPFPVPIIRTNGKWSFDPSETRVEMQARRIGADELDAIEICAGYVDAQRSYASKENSQDHMMEYAPRMKSEPGRNDGLYSAGAGEQLIPAGLADATLGSQKAGAKPYHGYYFRVLHAQGPNAPGGAHSWMANGRLIGGFGLVAWPAQYGATGINTFIVDQDGIIYEKDIEPAANGAEPAITRYDPDPSWRVVE